jgi:hypothetical protein
MTQDILKLKQDFIQHLGKYMQLGGARSVDDPSYYPEFDAGYTQEDIDRCEKLLDDYLASLTTIPATGQQDYILNAVKTIVLELNKLNEDCDHSLIETAEREQLCDIIIAAAQHVGLETDEEDITYEWREW